MYLSEDSIKTKVLKKISEFPDYRITAIIGLIAVLTNEIYMFTFHIDKIDKFWEMALPVFFIFFSVSLLVVLNNILVITRASDKEG